MNHLRLDTEQAKHHTHRHGADRFEIAAGIVGIERINTKLKISSSAGMANIYSKFVKKTLRNTLFKFWQDI